MAEKKLVEQITPMEEDFAQWYTDIVKKAELVDYTSVKGCLAIRPYGYAIWELIQRQMDDRFKALGHENVCMPMFIPESLLDKEKDHVEGFAPECAWVTMGGEEQLAERLCVRPTSETLFCDHYSRVIQSYRDLPKLYNQWVSVVRWEKTTRPFLRTREFLWQEGHTAHETAEEAMAETEQMLKVYASFCREVLNMPVIEGQKTEKERFAGAVSTYTIEAMMHDGKALQSGTSHYFGDGFAKAFDVKFADRNGGLSYVHQTSWGVSTRLIGGIIMTHGDDSGLVLPPKVAPIQVVVIPIASHKPGVLDKARELTERLRKVVRARIDETDNSPGWKFAQYEMKGVPIRLEVGPRDLENDQCVLVRRDSGEKTVCPLGGIENTVAAMLDDIGQSIYDKALENMERRTYDCASVEDINACRAGKGDGFIRAMWCGDRACEEKLKEECGISSRCIPFAQDRIGEKCACCGRPADKLVIWGVAY
ncbi:MAG: proline--tRNA ligase [Clostridia bacterium]|nr:proline--tRNA ligase [Clostridia bacterium]